MKVEPTEINPDYQEDALTVNQVSELSGHTMIEFGTPWCGHCQAAKPVIQEVLANYADVTHIKVYDGKGKKLGRLFSVKLWPTLILLHDGQEVARLVRPFNTGQVQTLLTQ
ncbi:thiol reductase thioredoxin [Psychromonas marina]|uniref:Thiol reductase thioredoxin n=1 Tax=Psychromonas marina TaxID=88364 RepID=A0ABQ6DZ70_9GAMM|nr:thioredoxin family protein [Psychromonas marina]GLS90290.1 thiol reductase thioredoxin [Psychromonas marina]